MTDANTTIFVTGATGAFGQLVVRLLLGKESSVIAGVRDPAKADNLKARGAKIRVADYGRPETLASAFEGVDTLLLISGNEVGQRVPQHKAVIDAAKAAGVGMIAYTSILRADTSPLALAAEHKATEDLLQASGVPHVLLRNGWYIENFMMGVPAALEHGAVMTAAGDGRFSAATRQDFAEAAVAVLTSGKDEAGQIYELAGSASFTMAEFAAELSRQSGKEIACVNLPEADYATALAGTGMPAAFAAVLAQTDSAASQGALFDDSRTLEALIGRPTTPVASVIAVALRDR